MEQSLYTRRLEVAKRYARENKLNNVVFPNPDAWLGIITAGKTYNDLRQSFLELGLDDARAAPLRRPHPEDGHAVPDGADHRARVRAGPRGDLRHRGEAAVPRDVRQERAVRHGQRAAHRRQVRRGGEGAAAALRRVRVRRDRPRAHQRACRARRASSRPRRGSRVWTRSTPAASCATADAHRVVLLGLPAQQLDGRRSRAASSRPASAATRWRCGWTATS